MSASHSFGSEDFGGAFRCGDLAERDPTTCTSIATTHLYRTEQTQRGGRLELLSVQALARVQEIQCKASSLLHQKAHEHKLLDNRCKKYKLLNLTLTELVPKPFAVANPVVLKP
eukprot:1674364-Amphidinium_carterae.1